METSAQYDLCQVSYSNFLSYKVNLVAKFVDLPLYSNKTVLKVFKRDLNGYLSQKVSKRGNIKGAIEV